MSTTVVIAVKYFAMSSSTEGAMVFSCWKRSITSCFRNWLIAISSSDKIILATECRYFFILYFISRKGGKMYGRKRH